jgi:hypothetical protein
VSDAHLEIKMLSNSLITFIIIILFLLCGIALVFALVDLLKRLEQRHPRERTQTEQTRIKKSSWMTEDTVHLEMNSIENGGSSGVYVLRDRGVV